MLTARFVLGIALVLSGCAHFQNTPAQDLALERWEMCKHAGSDVRLSQIRENGQILFRYRGPSNHAAVVNCLSEAAAEQAKSRRTTPPPEPEAAPLRP